MGTLNEKVEAVLNTLTTEGAALLERHGEDKKTAGRSGCEFAFRVIQLFAGQYVWFPKTDLAIRRRNAALQEEFKHSRESIQALASKHGLSSSQTYTILGKTRDMTSGKRNSHPVIEGIAIETARLLIKHGVPIIDAADAARGFAAVIVARWSGRFVIFPKGTKIKARERQEDIWKEYQAGATQDEIAVRHRLAITHVYSVIRQKCLANNIEPPSVKRYTEGLVTLKKRILEVAKIYEVKNLEIHTLLKTAANTVAEAQKIKQ